MVFFGLYTIEIKKLYICVNFMDMFIIRPDFYATYTEPNFSKLINNDDKLWQRNLNTVIEDIKGYLRSRYDVDLVFAPLQLFDLATAYLKEGRVYVYASTYAGKTYILGELTEYAGNVYYCNTEILLAEPFDTLKWTLIGSNYNIYTCTADSMGNYPTNTGFFSNTDSRNAKIVEVVIDMILYNLLNRLNPIDIPNNRKERYDGNDGKQSGGAIGWLKSVNRGLIEPNLPIIELGQTDQTGNIVMYDNASEVITKNSTF